MRKPALLEMTTAWRIGRRAGSIDCPGCGVECVLTRKKREHQRGLVLRLWVWLEKHEKVCTREIA